MLRLKTLPILRSLPLCAALLTTAALSTFVARPAHAEDDETTKEARRLYNEAREAMSAKKYKEAALNFEAASRLRPHAVALYTAAQAWELAGEPARAADAYAKALATPKLNDTQATRSRDRLAALEKETGVVVALGPETTRVQLDDQMEAGLPARLHGSPGAHVVTIFFADGNSETRNVTLEAGSSVELDTTKTATPEEKAPPKKDKVVPLAEPKTKAVREEPEPSSVWKTVGFVATGAGLATLAGGAVLGLAAKDAEDTYKAAPTQETLDHAKGLESNTNILFITGGVLTAAGIGLVVWQSMSKSSKPAAQDVALVIKPAGLFAEGSF